MRIAITCHSTYGGSGVVGAELGKELALRGHTVHFIGRSLPTRLTELSERIFFHEVELLDYPLFEAPHYTLALAVKMAEVAARERLDLLHVHYAIPHSISGYLAREMLAERHLVPVVTTLHGTDITLVGRDRSYLEVTRFAIAKSDGVTAISRYLSNTTCRSFGLPGVRVIPNFVDVDYYKRNGAEIRDRLAPGGEKLIVHVSNFRPVKRVNDCVEIFARVANDVPSRLVFVGDGPEASAAEALAERLGVADKVLFVGKQPRIVDYLSAADLLLLPSETESFGLALLEAMSCQVPVIASRVGGIPEVVEDGVCGYLHPVGDVEAMADSARRILTDPALGEQLGTAGRRIAIARFRAEDVVPLYIDYYRQVLERFDAIRSRGTEIRYLT